MGFGIGSIGDAFKGAVNKAAEVVGGAAETVGKGVQAVEQKVSETVRSAVESVTGHDGFDGDNNPGLGPLAESKPKGGTGRAETSSGTQVA